MMIHPHHLAALRLMITSAVICLAGEPVLAGERSFKPSEWVAVADDRLADARGGFDVSPGLKISFGFVRTITINGDLVNRVSFNLPDLSKITEEQAKMASSAIATSGVVQNGTGNQIGKGDALPFSAGMVIQNSLNDQKIQTLTVISTGVNSLALFKAGNAYASFKDSFLGSIGIR